ncbi:TPA: hypothetical protein HA238_05125, partial [Candidatus Micrarchaeota archaeon]|nr:hypothetical protein [Candidatus Micrarchaeota archaeon]
GAEIAISDKYSDGSKFMAGDELSDYEKAFSNEKLDINQIKDIDSIISAIKERVYYAGSVALGNSSNVTLSNRLIDSSFIYKSHEVCYSKYVAYAHFTRFSERVFGSTFVSKTKFCIKNYETFEDTRIMETVRTYHSSDCYYTSNCENCQNCLFSFNLRNQNNCIGNLELAPDKFKALKEKLVGDIRQTLESRKDLKSIVEIIGEVS